MLNVNNLLKTKREKVMVLIAIIVIPVVVYFGFLNGKSEIKKTEPEPMVVNINKDSINKDSISIGNLAVTPSLTEQNKAEIHSNNLLMGEKTEFQKTLEELDKKIELAKKELELKTIEYKIENIGKEKENKNSSRRQSYRLDNELNRMNMFSNIPNPYFKSNDKNVIEDKETHSRIEVLLISTEPFRKALVNVNGTEQIIQEGDYLNKDYVYKIDLDSIILINKDTNEIKKYFLKTNNNTFKVKPELTTNNPPETYMPFSVQN